MSGGGNLDIDSTLYAVTYNLEKADAFLTAAERLIGQPGRGSGGTDESDERAEDSDGHGHDAGRLLNHLVHLIDSTRAAVGAAQYAHSQTVATVDRHLADSSQVITLSKQRRRA